MTRARQRTVRRDHTLGDPLERLLADVGRERRRRETAERLSGWRVLRILLTGEPDEAAPALLARVLDRLLAGRPHRVDIEDASVVLSVGPPDAEDVIGVVAMVETVGGEGVSR